MFGLHILSIDVLSKIRQFINKIIIEKERNGQYPTKDVLFDIYSPTDQLYWSQSTIPDWFEPKKIYFLENPIPDLFNKGIK